MKIPTILGLIILFLILAGLVYGTLFVQKNVQKSKIIAVPTNLEQNNISHDQVTVTWETLSPTVTQLLVSTNSNMNPVFENLRDDRDNATSQARLTHISTINNLLPNTPYFIKTKIDGVLYPSTDTQIKTIAESSTVIDSNPLVGSVVDQNLRPVNDGLVFLLIQNTYPLSTGLLQDGNFILPLTRLTNKSDPSQPVDSESLANATLIIQKGDQKSEIKISLTDDSKPLPPIVLGQNFDFRQQTPATTPQN